MRFFNRKYFHLKKNCVKIKFQFLFIFLSVAIISSAQIDTNLVIEFNFNKGKIIEKNDLIYPTAKGISFSDDRFGNSNSAVYTNGSNFSYISLGVSNLLKPKNGTIALWVKLERRVHFGKGLDIDPIIVTKNGPGTDYIFAYNISLSNSSGRFSANATLDSTFESSICSKQKIEYQKWYHLAITFNKNNFTFYINGKKTEQVPKNFVTKYLITDSVVVGHTASTKNERYSIGDFDDIFIYHRVLSDNEILLLYKAPNPNKFKNLLNEIINYAAILAIFTCVIIIILYINKQKLKKQKQKFELNNRINELEIKVIKNQMNPHFISNCLAAIQELIYTENYKRAAQYIAKFSFFMRQVLNYSDKTYITLEEEITIVKLYVELEQLRFANEFEFTIHVDKSINVNEILLPSLITQPFIENAIWHGLLPLQNIRKPSLNINVFKQNNIVFLEIGDNGVGRQQNKINNKNSKGTKLVTDKLDIINKLLNGNDYKLQIIDLVDKHNKPSGTKIKIQLAYTEE